MLLVRRLENTGGSTINHGCVGTSEYIIILRLVTIVKTFVVDD